ncbi:MAG: hypothetical protein O2779_03225 [Nanoarchaeota archaeon]|nr:hypothetical protein [Nanoarchaeota archaeon]
MKNNIFPVVLVFLLSVSVVSGLEQPINDFLWHLQVYPSEYILVFEEAIDSETEAVALSFMDHYGLSRSRLDSDVNLPADKLVLIGNPAKHKVIKTLGLSGDSLLTLDSSNGNKLVIAGSVAHITASVTSLMNTQLAAPAGSPASSQAASQAASSQPEVEQLTPAAGGDGFLSGVREQYAPGMSNTLFLAILGSLIVSPMLAFGVVHRSKKKKVTVQKDQLKQYLTAYVQKGYTIQYLQQYFKPQLLQRGWNNNHIDEVFEEMGHGAGKTVSA